MQHQHGKIEKSEADQDKNEARPNLESGVKSLLVHEGCGEASSKRGGTL
jgi:hypothetical protein